MVSSGGLIRIFCKMIFLDKFFIQNIFFRIKIFKNMHDLHFISYYSLKLAHNSLDLLENVNYKNIDSYKSQPFLVGIGSTKTGTTFFINMLSMSTYNKKLINRATTISRMRSKKEFGKLNHFLTSDKHTFCYFTVILRQNWVPF